MSQGLPFNRDWKGDPARYLLGAARERSRVAAADLFLGTSGRLTEWQRTTASALLTQLVEGIESAFRAQLAGELTEHPTAAASLSSPHVPIAFTILERGDLLRDLDVAAFLMRRLEEHRIYRAAEGAAGTLIQELVRHENESVSRAAMAFLIAGSRRFDRFLEPALADVELSAELQHRLVWSVAAALRTYLTREHALPAPTSDRLVAGAAEQILARYDEGERIEALAAQLVNALRNAGEFDARIIARALSEGSLALFLAGSASLAQVDVEAAWEIMSDPHGSGGALLLKASAFSREVAASVLLTLVGPDDAGEALSLFDRLRSTEAEEAIRLWRADPGYRAAIARLIRSEAA